jgi:hypothetical protein
VIANNRVGEEVFAKSSIKFYGGSFISGQHGQVVAQVRPSYGDWKLDLCCHIAQGCLCMGIYMHQSTDAVRPCAQL